MSSVSQTETNIANAVAVLQATYGSVHRLMRECDEVMTEMGRIPTGSNFLRWKTDQRPEGWLVSSFIKLYESPSPSRLYFVEVNLSADWDDIGADAPYLVVAVLEYPEGVADLKKGMGDHWLYYHPFYDVANFSIALTSDGIWRAEPKSDRTKQRYQGFAKGAAKAARLVSIDDTDGIRGVCAAVETIERAQGEWFGS